MATIQECFINLRNDMKTWITNNLRLKANKSDLTASDGVEFQFGVDDNGNYGYKLDNEIIPFNNNNRSKFDNFFVDCGQYIGDYNYNSFYDDRYISSNFRIHYIPYFGTDGYLSHSNPFRNKNKITIKWSFKCNVPNASSDTNLNFQVGIGDSQTSFKSDSKYYYKETCSMYNNGNYSTSGTLTVDLSDLNEDLYVVLYVGKDNSSYASTSYVVLEVTSITFE